MIDILRARRSVRKFTSQQLSREHLDVLEEAVLRSPSSHGKRPWTFLFVTDAAKRAAVSIARPGSGLFVADAPLAIVVACDETQSDVWEENCSIAATIAQLTAESLGLSSCWFQIRNRPHNHTTSAEDYLRGLFNLPAHMRIDCVIAVGYAAMRPAPVPRDQLPNGKIIRFPGE